MLLEEGIFNNKIDKTGELYSKGGVYLFEWIIPREMFMVIDLIKK